jgi:hypothetical protein
MFIPFEELPNNARVWIYQANRSLAPEEQNYVLQQGKLFAEQWAAHGQPLRASVAVLHRHFVVISVDEQHQLPTGCSIDGSVGFVRSVADVLQTKGAPIDFFDRTLVAFWMNDSVELIPLAQVKRQLTDGQIPPDTLMFNNLAATKAELASRWQLPVQESWLARYLPKVSA